MTDEEEFESLYRNLEARMKTLAEADGDVFLPNPAPLGPVDYVFVWMEPSLHGWARSVDEGKEKVAIGFRNFHSSVEDFILHFSIRQYLCDPNQRYHITDISKGAMPVSSADVERTQRYDRWTELLNEEINLVSKAGVDIFAVGSNVARHLRQHRFPVAFMELLHYSPQAASHRAAMIVGHEDLYEAFKSTISHESFVTVADEVLHASGIPSCFRSETLKRLMKSQLTESRMMLIFNYKRRFEATKTQNQTA